MNEILREQAEILDLAHVLIRDMDDRIVLWNAGAERLYGYTKDEAVGRISHELLKTAFPESLETLRARLLASGEWQGELLHTSSDGNSLAVASHWVLHRDEQGIPISILEINNNITESRQARQTLAETNTRLQMLSDTASQLLLTDDPQGLVQSLCERVMQVLDCQAFFNYLVDEERECLHLNAFAGIPHEVGKSIEWLEYGVAVCGCVAQDGQRVVSEDIFNNNDPRTTLVKGYGIQAYACHPLLSTGGRVIGTLSFGSRTKACFSDDELDLMKAIANQVATAMERIRLLAELSHRAAETDAILDSMADGLSITDADGRVVRTNAAARRLLDMGSEDMAESIAARLKELMITKPDGTPFTMKESPS